MPQLVSQTPLRDQMKLNQFVDPEQQAAWERSSVASGFTSKQSSYTSQIDVKASLASLPTPKNEFTVSDEQIQQFEREIKQREALNEMKKKVDLETGDAEEREALEKKAQHDAMLRERSRMSSVMRINTTEGDKKMLPRPSNVNESMFEKTGNVAEDMIRE